MNQQQATYQRQRAAFTEAMQRDGWTAVICGGDAWAHSSDADWVVPDSVAFWHYVATWETPMCVRDVLPF